MVQPTLFDTKPPVFDAERSENLKHDGMELAAEKRQTILEIARDIAVGLAERDPNLECTADDVQEVLIKRGYSPSDLGNAAGSIFAGPVWKFTGNYRKSSRVTNRYRDIKVWRLRR
jgi:hypothetical protein